MPDPQIRYARATDGVSLAYWTLGEGPPLLLSPQGMISHIVQQYRVPQIRRWLDLLASRYTVLQYDYRGFGSSQRDVDNISMETMLTDIDVVATAAAFDRFALFGSMINGGIACAYAHRFPARVSHLILWSAGWGGPRNDAVQAAASLDEIAAKDWNLYSRLRMQAQWGWYEADQGRAYARIFRESTNAETYFATLDVWKQIEIAHLLKDLEVPTLVVRSDSPAVPNPGASERLAREIHDARLVTIRSRDYLPWISNDAATEAVGILAEFLEGQQIEVTEMPSAPINPQVSGTAIILFTDIANSTALTERLGDAAFREKARALDARLRVAVRDHGGTVVDAKTLGDGILATFPAASQAIAASIACSAAGAEHGLPLHVGLHAGDVIRESDNVFGGAVNIAARISALAPPGEVLVSRTVADLARTSAGVTFEDRGDHALKGIAEPQRLYAVRRS